jgi:hypothetical protein
MTVALVIDLMLAALMVATIVYAIVLNRRLAAFRRGKDEMMALIADFTEATEKAHRGTEALRGAAEASGQALDGSIREAKALREDLGFLIERGAAVADRLVHDTRGARQAPPPKGPDADAIASLRKILEATR